MFVIKIDSVLARKQIRELANRLGERETGKAIASALNRAAPAGRTKGSSVIRSRYRIKKRDLDKRMGTTKASWKHLRANIYSHGVPIPVHLFRYKQVKKGVRVTILGKRNVIPHAFVATMRNGHTGVYARGHYTSTGFKFRTTRKNGGRSWAFRKHQPVGVSNQKFKQRSDLPITQLTTISQGPMFSHPTVIGPVMNRIEDMLGVRIEHELNWLLNNLKL